MSDLNPTKKQLALLKKGLGGIYALKCKGSSDPEESLVLIDLENFLEETGPGGLTERQQKALRLVVFEGLTEKEAGVQLEVTQQAVHYALKAALVKVYRHLKDPKTKPKGPVFDPIERQQVLDMYHEGCSYKEIAIELDKNLKSVRNKIRDMRERGEVDVQRRLETIKVRKDSAAQGPS